MIRVFIFLVLSLSACTKKEQWIGFVYPDKSNLRDYKIIGEFSTLNDCLGSVNVSVASNGSYECAKNCDKSKTPMVCEETVGNEK